MAQPVRLQPRFLYNPELRSIVVIAPSLIMLVLMLVPPLLIAVSIVREKETGAIYNIASSTVTRLEFLLGKLLPGQPADAMIRHADGASWRKPRH